MNKQGLLYEGKAKKIYATDAPDALLVEYKDSLTAFNAQKKGSFPGKGAVNLEMTVLLYRVLAEAGIRTHLKEQVSSTEILVQKLDIIPLEVVVRNVLAGSTAKKFAKPEGTLIKNPLVEFYYKNDELEDPFISDDQILALELASEIEISTLKEIALRVNRVLGPLFQNAGLRLIDFKIEVGRSSAGLVLGDEISPDCCRLWDVKTGEKMDKDRFRRDLGNVQGAYQEVLNRIKGVLS